ncbi:carbonic anhydrase [Mesorhizobium sp. LCM 4577]|uniref:carbonic anhydrase n=1 Tax=unclassified Mesorhizobium TaxID=325217 RepID=UPI0008DA9326|nr:MULTISPECIES: carbonic anhydrase [unclassified Mesorhizobium]OHV60808.1 carbonic anhydrase [Mesorhizobium sp. LCM 4576]OHV63715.1 carbonic anhydrase [Mesorhizobium sp. LCM 4577]OHV74775.1 carbonic anhydrase [Mesorhizobium sp. LCM 4576]
MLNDLFEKNRAWSEERRREDPHYFERLSNLQRPQYLWIGCSDSRVPANTITGLEPGEVFVHRNVANLVHPSDLNLLSVLEYAIDVLEVSHVIVCGHYGCGGIRAALDGERHGIIDHWLQPIRDVAEQNKDELDRVPDLTSRLKVVCEMSTRNQVARLERTPIVQWAWKRGKRVRIHGWVYGLTDGLISDLKCSVPPLNPKG